MFWDNSSTYLNAKKGKNEGKTASPLQSLRSRETRRQKLVATTERSELEIPGKKEREADCERSISTTPENLSAIRRSMAGPARARNRRRSELCSRSQRLHTRPNRSLSSSACSFEKIALSSSSVRISLMQSAAPFPLKLLVAMESRIKRERYRKTRRAPERGQISGKISEAGISNPRRGVRRIDEAKGRRMTSCNVSDGGL